MAQQQHSTREQEVNPCTTIPYNLPGWESFHLHKKPGENLPVKEDNLINRKSMMSSQLNPITKMLFLLSPLLSLQLDTCPPVGFSPAAAQVNPEPLAHANFCET